VNRKKLLSQFIITFTTTFLVAAGVSYLYGLIRHGVGLADWTTAVRLAFILGVALPVTGLLGNRGDGR
jgi:hypothetical protein